jgi:hypothetical protein
MKKTTTKSQKKAIKGKFELERKGLPRTNKPVKLPKKLTIIK